MEPHTDQIEDVSFLLTASEAYVVLEEAFLDAREEIVAGFRIFDPTTHLLSERAREIGTDWFDLVVHTLKRGVRITLILTDFDPVAAGEMHRATWRSVRLMHAAAEVSGRPELLTCTATLHPAAVGWMPRLMLMIKSRPLLLAQIVALNALSGAAWKRAWSEKPGLHSLVRHGKVGLRMRPLLIPPLQPVTHHQKMAVFDRERLYIGGLDLDDRRYDTPDHEEPPRQTWHDTQLMVTGPVAKQAHAHLTSFRETVAGKSAPIATPGLLRTLSKPRRFNLGRMSPRTTVNELARVHYHLAERAERLIYLESQFFRDRLLARRLAQAARKRPDLKLIVILPGAPEEVAFDGQRGPDQRFGEYLQAKYVSKVQRAFGDRAFFGTPVKNQSGGEGRGKVHGAPIIYVHAKVSVFDETDAVVSSANLNGRSFRWDTEAGLWLTRPADVATIRKRCFEHWLPDNPDPKLLSCDTAVEAWRTLAHQNAAASPEERQGFIVPYSTKPARRFGRSLPGIPEDIV